MIIKAMIGLIPIRKWRRYLRQQNSVNQEIKHQKRIAQMLHKKYLEPYISGDLKKYNIKPKKNIGTTKIIWQFWGQGIDENTPKIVRACIESVKKFRGDYRHIILTEKTISDYIDLPDFVYDKLKNNPEFRYAFFSDILRVCLLAAYGGIWIDATILLTHEIDDNIKKSPFFAYQRSRRPKDYRRWENFNINYFCWKNGWRVKLLNSFIVSKPKNKIICALCDILLSFWENEQHFPHYFLFQILFDEMMCVPEYARENCEIVGDLAPHEMQINAQMYDTDDLWNRITNQSGIHKLTYFDRCEPLSVLERVFYTYFPQSSIKPTSGTDDITFVTMLFNMKNDKSLNKIKQADRNFNNFYLQSLKKLSKNYKNLVMWCDQETAQYIKKNKLQIKTKIMEFSQLPYYKYRNQFLFILQKMKKICNNTGYLLKNLSPENVVDYLILVLSKPYVMKWALENDKNKSKYFYWIDAGTNNRVYYRCWENFDGIFDIKTKRTKFAFMTPDSDVTYKKIYKTNDIDIALIRTWFEICAGCFVMHRDIVYKFFDAYVSTLEKMINDGIISTEQATFAMMLKHGFADLFDFAKTYNYVDVMNKIAKFDEKLQIS